MSRKLTSKQLLAAYLLATGEAATTIADRLHMRRETLSRWKKIPEFNQEIERLLAEEREQVRHKLTHLSEASITAMWAELQNYDKGNKRLQAALNVIKLLGIEHIAAPNAPVKEP